MKKIRKDKNRKASGDNVETPPPPQVMNPSELPEKQNTKEKSNKDNGAQNEKSPEREKLSPSEEL